MAKFAPHPTLFALKRDANDAMMINKVKLVWGTEQRKAVLDGERHSFPMQFENKRCCCCRGRDCLSGLCMRVSLCVVETAVALMGWKMASWGILIQY